MRSLLERLRISLTFGATRRAKFYALLGDYVKDGTDLVRAIDDVHTMYVGMADARRHITRDVLLGYRGGSGQTARLGETIERYAPRVEAIAIDSADVAGRTEEGLRIAAEAATVSATIKATIYAKMLKPVGYFLGAVALLVLLRFTAVKAFSEALPRYKWPMVPTILGHLTDFVPIGVPLLVAGLAAYFTAFVMTRNTWVGAGREFADRWIFPFTIYRQISMAGMLSSLSVMIRSGVPFPTAVERLREGAGAWNRQHLSRVLLRLRDGAPDGTALAPLFDGEARFRIEAYGKRSTFHAAMANISAEINQTLIERLSFRFGLIQVGCIFLIAVLVGLAMTSPLLLSMAMRAGG